ncbi:hypothetical protein Rt10032_c22g6571 [Rhodotorula toruloides]|uniref:Uncharacterized protein n=1 Tax=Rhodotorula toruloides TaxID=5286 RepID=A0A511KSN7_RHOTO|nr:hypothetical protein Rt10032_c22g6571 [Rhodotorula toruloides]
MTTTSSSDPPTSPLFRLSAELLDHILSFVVPSSPRLARRTLARLLLIHSSLVPLIRRRLYARISLTIGSSSGSDLAFLSLLRDGVAGLYVRVLRLELPKPDWSVIVQDRDPAEFLVARPVLDQKATVERVREVFERTPYVRNVEVDVQLGVPLEWVHHRDVKGEKADKEAIALEKAMAAWTSLEGFVTALPDAKQRLQIWSDPTATSHFVHALTTWSSLTTLDLWRVRLVLPCDDTSLAFPTFALGELNLRQVELGDELELKWFLGEAGGKDTNATLLSIFPADRFPSFASTLDVLDLTLSSPIPSATAARFARFSNLKELTLAGPGVDLALCEAFFGVGEDSVKTKSTDTPAPLSSLRDLAFHYLPHPSISIPALASLLCPATTSSTTTAPPLTSLTDLRFHTTYPLPRTLDWRTRRLTREPVWSALADDEVGDEGWREVFRCAGRINRARRRAASGRGESGVVRRVRVWQNRFEMGYDDDVESEGEEGEDEDEEEGAASEVDMNALFVPASGSEGEEENAAWVRRTLQDEEDEDDF